MRDGGRARDGGTRMGWLRTARQDDEDDALVLSRAEVALGDDARAEEEQRERGVSGDQTEQERQPVGRYEREPPPHEVAGHVVVEASSRHVGRHPRRVRRDHQGDQQELHMVEDGHATDWQLRLLARGLHPRGD